MADVVETQSELEALKLIADNMGIEYSPRIGLEALKARVEEQRAKSPAVQNSKRQELVREATKLVRVTITNMDPQTKQWTGTWVMGANNAVGTIKRFVPFEQVTHIEEFLYKILKDKKYRKTVEKSDGKGGKYKENIFVPAFNVAVLPPLTEEELKNLALEQAKRGVAKD